MPSARLLKQINKICETELWIHPLSFVISTQLLLKSTFRLHKVRVGHGVCPTGFGATFAAVFVLIYRLREFSLSAVTNCFELVSIIKICHC